MRHIWPYMRDSGYVVQSCVDQLFRVIDAGLGQMLVVMFLFYSGYGVMESIKTKGSKYVDSIPRKRVLTTLLNFDVAVLVYLLLDISLGIRYSACDTELAFTGWTSIGNSNWYIFVIILCYLITYISHRIVKQDAFQPLGGKTCLYIYGSIHNRVRHSLQQ